MQWLLQSAINTLISSAVGSYMLQIPLGSFKLASKVCSSFSVACPFPTLPRCLTMSVGSAPFKGAVVSQSGVGNNLEVLGTHSQHAVTTVGCAGGAAGAANGVFGRDGSCEHTGSGSVLSQYKASHTAPGGGGAGGKGADATAGLSGTVTIRY